MRDKNKKAKNALRELMEHENFSREEVEYFSRSLSLKPLNTIVSNFFENSPKLGFVLDAGCGIGLFAFMAYSEKNGVSQPTFSTVGIDLSHKRLQFASILLGHNSKIHFVRGSINHLPFKDKAFNATLIHDVFCQLSYHPFIPEIARVTESLIYFDVPNKFFYVAFPFLKPNPSYITYELADVRKKLFSVGFEVAEILPAPLLYLMRKIKLPIRIIRPLFDSLLVWPIFLRDNLCNLWPLVILCAQRCVRRKD